MSDAASTQDAGGRPTIGFVGLGNMGLPMCLRLVADGYDVTAFDIRPDALDAAVGAGAHRGASSADVAGVVDPLMTSLPEPHHVDAVMREHGALAALRSGSMWVDLTTNRRELVEALATEAPDGVDVIVD